jgi:hypothetical protein
MDKKTKTKDLKDTRNGSYEDFRDSQDNKNEFKDLFLTLLNIFHRSVFAYLW